MYVTCEGGRERGLKKQNDKNEKFLFVNRVFLWLRVRRKVMLTISESQTSRLG